ncbi:hypothetical protein E3T46_17490 [Cryobacterium sp. Hh11]|uniref:hypothetical protein n=1 Tax=Cryobacterium sp. Hh11 TaxID=2555868 RepID=UPI00106C2A54|nr:hypothetical protein [Cryobacterium sp. Hh11]TFD47585.1 hypothetical protein E3T46_17490 [Cryobacterium sp. Hh11]
MSTERVTRQTYTEQIRLEVTLSNGHKITLRDEPHRPDYHTVRSRREWVDRQQWDQQNKAREFGLTVATLEVFTDRTEVETIERTYTKSELTETRS